LNVTQKEMMYVAAAFSFKNEAAITNNKLCVIGFYNSKTFRSDYIISICDIACFFIKIILFGSLQYSSGVLTSAKTG